MIYTSRPSGHAIETFVRRFNAQNAYAASQYTAVLEAVKAFPANGEYGHIFVKVNLINGAFKTAIGDTEGVAKDIFRKVKDIDARLRRGDPGLVDDIAKYAKKDTKRRNYSFATKYCHCHQAGLFPIYDENVRTSLYQFNKHWRFGSFTRESLRHYPTFKFALQRFREAFEAEEMGNETIDRFLWALGRRHLRDRRGKGAGTAPSPRAKRGNP